MLQVLVHYVTIHRWGDGPGVSSNAVRSQKGSLHCSVEFAKQRAISLLQRTHRCSYKQPQEPNTCLEMTHIRSTILTLLLIARTKFNNFSDQSHYR